MSLLWYHNRKSFLLKFIYLSGIIAILTIVFNLLKFQSTFTDNKAHKKKPSTSYIQKDRISDTQLTLHNSTFKGVNKDLEPYEISASTASKVTENQFNLKQVGANYTIGNSSLLINAKNGLLNNLDNWMDLRDDVQILFNNLLLNTAEIHINLITKEALSEVQVEMIYKNSTIQADSFTSKDNSNIINFQGNVQTRIKLEDF